VARIIVLDLWIGKIDPAPASSIVALQSTVAVEECSSLLVDFSTTADGKTSVDRRSIHRCHRIRASSSGIATPSQCGITRAV
jgi:hypothetical protein